MESLNLSEALYKETLVKQISYLIIGIFTFKALRNQKLQFKKLQNLQKLQLLK